MREYARISPQFWHGETGQRFREQGAEAQVLALYLLTSPHSNQIGLYFLPLAYAAHDTGIPHVKVVELMVWLESEALDFCKYDRAKDCVWVPKMAAWQIAPELEERDKQIAGIKALLRTLPRTYLIWEFWQRYAVPFRLGDWASMEWPLEAPPKGLHKPLGSTDKDNDKDKEKEKETDKEPISISDIGDSACALLGDIESKAERKAKNALWKRIKSIERTPEWQAWWKSVLGSIWNHSEALPDFEDVLKHVEAAVNRRVGDSKGIGESKAPERLLVKKTTHLCKKHRIRWPQFPEKAHS